MNLYVTVKRKYNMILNNSIISNNNCIPRYDIYRNIVVISNNFLIVVSTFLTVVITYAALIINGASNTLDDPIYACSIQLISELFLPIHEQGF
jgi:hypothetical protein